MVVTEARRKGLGTLPTAWVAGLLMLLVCPICLAASSTYRWVDEKGQVHYGDAIPSNQAGMGHAELDRQGRVLKQAPRTRYTTEEHYRRDQEARRQEELRSQREAQIRRDRALLSTYTSEQEIDLTRDRALELEQLTLQGIQLRLERATSRLAQVNEEANKMRSQVRRLPPYMINLKQSAQEDVIQLSSQILQRTQAIEDIRKRYEADKLRWRGLKSGQITLGSPSS